MCKSFKIHIDEKKFLQGEPFVHFMNLKHMKEMPDFFVVQKNVKKYFCFSDKAKKILDVYVDGFERIVPFFPTDREEERQEVYWNLEVPSKEYLVKRNFFSQEEPKMCTEPETGCYCFQYSDEAGSYFIISQHVVENLLRREIMGIAYVPIERMV